MCSREEILLNLFPDFPSYMLAVPHWDNIWFRTAYKWNKPSASSPPWLIFFEDIWKNIISIIL